MCSWVHYLRPNIGLSKPSLFVFPATVCLLFPLACAFPLVALVYCYTPDLGVRINLTGSLIFHIQSGAQ